jgi:hypothetical protein
VHNSVVTLDSKLRAGRLVLEYPLVHLVQHFVPSGRPFHDLLETALGFVLATGWNTRLHTLWSTTNEPVTGPELRPATPLREFPPSGGLAEGVRSRHPQAAHRFWSASAPR